MIKGVVKWFDKKKGYGFIQDMENVNNSYFVHWSAITGDDKFKTLNENDKVYFEVGTAPDGKTCAKNVSIRE
jgi:CspA family cold shock protein